MSDVKNQKKRAKSAHTHVMYLGRVKTFSLITKSNSILVEINSFDTKNQNVFGGYREICEERSKR